MVSYGFAAWFLWANRRVPGLMIIALGGILELRGHRRQRRRDAGEPRRPSPWPDSRTSRASSRARCPSATRSSSSSETYSPCRPPGRSTTSSAWATSASSWAPSCWCTSSAVRRCSGRGRATSRRSCATAPSCGSGARRRSRTSATGCTPWRWSRRWRATGRARGRWRACCSRKSRRPQSPVRSAVIWWIVCRARLVMLGCHAVSATAVSSLLLAGTPSLVHFYAVAACLGVTGALFRPSVHASLPNIVPGPHIVAANALLTGTFHIALMVGPVLGAAIAAGYGPGPAFVANAASFVVAGILLYGVRMPIRERTRGSARQAIAEGFRHVLATRLTRGVMIVIGLVMVAASIRTPLEPLYVMQTLDENPQALGPARRHVGHGHGAGFRSRPAARAVETPRVAHRMHDRGGRRMRHGVGARAFVHPGARVLGGRRRGERRGGHLLSVAAPGAHSRSPPRPSRGGLRGGARRLADRRRAHRGLDRSARRHSRRVRDLGGDLHRHGPAGAAHARTGRAGVSARREAGSRARRASPSLPSLPSASRRPPDRSGRARDLDSDPRGTMRGGRQVVGTTWMALVGFVLLATLALLPSPAQAAFPGKNGKIVYVTQAPGESPTIHTIEADGTGVANFPPSFPTAGFPTWSPDGTRIAYDVCAGCIVTVDANGSGMEGIYDFARPLTALDWSPDGQQMVFSSELCCDSFQPPTIFITDVVPGCDGACPTNEIRDLATGPAWSPDGSRIAFFQTSPPLDGIQLMAPDGTGVVTVPNSELAIVESFGSAADWSPDGQHLVFRGAEQGAAGLFTIGPDGTNLIRLSTTPAGRTDRSPVWSPDGTRIAFTRSGGGTTELLGDECCGWIPNSAPGSRSGSGRQHRLATHPDQLLRTPQERDARRRARWYPPISRAPFPTACTARHSHPIPATRRHRPPTSSRSVARTQTASPCAPRAKVQLHGAERRRADHGRAERRLPAPDA